MSKLLLALAALGLTVPTVPAVAKPQVEFGLSIRSGDRYNNDWRRDPRFRNYYGSQRHYNNYPRCNRWEVAVRNPYRYNRYICVDRDHYRTYWNRDRLDPYRR